MRRNVRRKKKSERRLTFGFEIFAGAGEVVEGDGCATSLGGGCRERLRSSIMGSGHH